MCDDVGTLSSCEHCMPKVQEFGTGVYQSSRSDAEPIAESWRQNPTKAVSYERICVNGVLQMFWFRDTWARQWAWHNGWDRDTKYTILKLSHISRYPESESHIQNCDSMNTIIPVAGQHAAVVTSMYSDSTVVSPGPQSCFLSHRDDGAVTVLVLWNIGGSLWWVGPPL